MTKYTVVTDFHDLQDDGKLYKKDETFPRPANKKVSKARLKELSTKDNAEKTIFIKEEQE